jgi:threonine/homoserine/homoserine lactone efflux protein
LSPPRFAPDSALLGSLKVEPSGVPWTVLLLWLGAVLSPGPNFMVISQAALSRSLSTGLGASVGIAAGAGLYASLALFGLSALLDHFRWLERTVRFLGGLYLVWLAVQAWRHADVRIPSPAPLEASRELISGLKRGLATSLTNPKSMAFFIGIFAAAVSESAQVETKLAILLAGVGIELTWYTLLSWLLSQERARGTYFRSKVMLNRLFAALFLLFGAQLMLTRG